MLSHSFITACVTVGPIVAFVLEEHVGIYSCTLCACGPSLQLLCTAESRNLSVDMVNTEYTHEHVGLEVSSVRPLTVAWPCKP